MRLANEPPDGDRRTVLQVNIQTGDAREFTAQFGHHLIDGQTLGPRFQHDDERALIGAAPRAARADRRGPALDIGIVPDDLCRFGLMGAHRLERDSIGAFGEGIEPSLIFGRNEIFGHGAEQHDGGHQTGGKQEENQRPVGETPAQAAFIPILHPVKGGLAQAVEAAVDLPMHMGLDQPAAQHRRETYGDDAGDKNRDHNGDSEFVQQPNKLSPKILVHRADAGDVAPAHLDGRVREPRSAERALHARRAA